MTQWIMTREQGLTVHDILRDMTSSRNWQYQIVSIARAPSFRGSQISNIAQEYTARARENHKKFGFGFWEFLLADLTNGPDDIKKAVVERTLFHTGGECREVHAEELRKLVEDGSFLDVPDRTMFSLSSRVRPTLTSAWQNIPMLDFGLPSSSKNDETAVLVLEALDVEGYLFDSGRSYHFLGNSPIDDESLRELLASAQLLSPYIDARWVSHSLIEGRCAIRVSNDQDRNATLPHLVARS